MSQVFSKNQRVSEKIQRKLASLIQISISDPRLKQLTINDVKVSKDLSIADIYFSLLVRNEKTINNAVQALEKAKGFLRYQLAQNIQLRIVPKLRFHYDEIVDRSANLDSLIQQAILREK